MYFFDKIFILSIVVKSKKIRLNNRWDEGERNGREFAFVKLFEFCMRTDNRKLFTQ